MMRPDELADLTVELNYMLNQWDPIGVADIVDDEYLSLTGQLLELLGRGASRATVCQFLFDVACEYGTNPEAADAFGARVFAWFQTKSPVSRTE